jgi:hypothetical protein
MNIPAAHIFSVVAIAVLLSCTNNSTTKEAPTPEQTTAATPSSGTLTDKHVQIPNSPLYIIPPAGFTVNTTTMQLAKEYANFMRMKILSGYTPETFFGGLKSEADKNFPGSWKEENFIADGHKAVIYQYNTGAVMQYYLAFTDGTTDEMIIVNHESEDAATGKAMYDALKTVVYKP